MAELGGVRQGNGTARYGIYQELYLKTITKISCKQKIQKQSALGGVWFGTVSSGLVRCGVVRYGLVWENSFIKSGGEENGQNINSVTHDRQRC